MSHKWTANIIGALSDSAMAEVRRIIHKLPWAVSHDDMNVALKVFDYAEVLCGNVEADAWMQAFDEHYVLRVLLDSGDFHDYPHRADTLFDAPDPVRQLEGGPENAF
ncbi:hypothetical protein DFH09DRAFT_1067315 [Mycena vulgaris]|nr:hypothetical protein DFH09DRAFT_1067315 [Mycena vulgaris]